MQQFKLHNSRFKTVFAFWILNAALMTSACSPPPSSESSYLIVGSRTAPNNLDPRQGSDEASTRVAQLIFGSLMEIGDDLRARPHLAERLDNPDPLTYIAHLRHGVKFHDGHELTSKDVVYTFSAFLDPQFLSPWKGAFRVLESVTALDDYTVKFALKEPFASFPIQLVEPPVVPDGSGATMSTHPVGTGPYRFVRYATDDQVVLAAFDDYFLGRPANPGIVFKVIPDDTMRGLELRKASIDVVINDLPPDIVYQLEKRGEFKVVRSPGVDFMYLAFNMRDPILSDQRVRHAIGYAINREAIVKYMRRDLAHVATGLVPPQAWAYEPDVFQFTYDPERAKQLLDEAGYRDPDGDGPRPRLRLSMKTSTNEEYRLQATVMQQDLAKVGIDVDLESYEFATFYADVQKGNFQIYALQWVAGSLVDPDIIRRVFHSEQVPPAGFNRGHYNNPEVDRLIDRATTALDEKDRKVYYSAAQRIIAEDAPYIPIWNRVNAVVAVPTVANLHLSVLSNFESLKDATKTAGGGRAAMQRPEIYDLRLSSSVRASGTYGESGCFSTISLKAFFASSVFPFCT
jgi:peptide/nickel transport system substrate-binding protein